MHSQLVSFFETIPKDADGNPLVAEIDHRGKLRPFDASGYAEYRGAGPEKLRHVFAEEPVFITTDTPVAIVNRTRERFGIKTPGTILSLPLSPTRVLLMDDRLDQPKGHYYPLGSHGPAPFNLEAWHCCDRFMISPRRTDEVCAEMLAWADAAHEQDGAV